MSSVNRRFVIKAAAAAAAGSAMSRIAVAAGRRPELVIVGGGFAGATVAKYLKIGRPDLPVTLVEPKKAYTTCPESNHVIAGIKPISAITFSYEALRRKYGVRIVHERAVAVAPNAKTVRLSGGGTLEYQRLVVAPGIDFLWDAVPGFGPAVADRIPHAWKAGRQTMILRDQLAAMPDGGLVVLSPPPGIYRCGPAPYERASLIADFLKTRKPRSKLLILDPKDRFPHKDEFRAVWAASYPDIVEWIPLSQDGRIVRIDADAMTVETDFGERHKAAVINFIPAQRAGDVAVASGLTDDTGWCPVDPVTLESRLVPGIHVLGDSVRGTPLPKAASAANSMAKAAARVILRPYGGRPSQQALYDSRCFSLAAADHGMESGGYFGVKAGEFVALDHPAGSGSRPKSPRALAASAHTWFERITGDAFS